MLEIRVQALAHTRQALLLGFLPSPASVFQSISLTLSSININSDSGKGPVALFAFYISRKGG
jgi:hypothetical protein